MKYLVLFANLDLKKMALICLILPVLYWYFVYSGDNELEETVKNLSLQIQEKKKSIVKTKNEITLLSEKYKEVRKIEVNYKKFSAYVYEVFSYNALIKAINERVRSAGVVSLKIRQSPRSVPGVFYNKIAVDLQLRGTFSQMVLFLANLTNLDKFLNIDFINFKISKKGVEEEILQINTKVIGYEVLQKAAVNQKGS